MSQGAASPPTAFSWTSTDIGRSDTAVAIVVDASARDGGPTTLLAKDAETTGVALSGHDGGRLTISWAARVERAGTCCLEHVAGKDGIGPVRSIG